MSAFEKNRPICHRTIKFDHASTNTTSCTSRGIRMKHLRVKKATNNKKKYGQKSQQKCTLKCSIDYLGENYDFCFRFFFLREESFGDSSSSYRKRQQAHSQQAQGPAGGKKRNNGQVCSNSNNSRSSKSQQQRKEEELAIYNIDTIDVETTGPSKPSFLQRSWSFVKKYGAIFQMFLALVFLCFPGNLVTIYFKIRSPNVSTRLAALRLHPSFWDE